jgi:hypothetical protein
MDEEIIFETVFLAPDSTEGIPVTKLVARSDLKCRVDKEPIRTGDVSYYLTLPDADPGASEKYLCSKHYNECRGARLVRPKNGTGPNVVRRRAPNGEWV